MSNFPNDPFFEECRRNNCPGCFGILLACGHTFRCVGDPEIMKHRCAASWTPILWSLLMAVIVVAIIILIRKGVV